MSATDGSPCPANATYAASFEWSRYRCHRARKLCRSLACMERPTRRRSDPGTGAGRCRRDRNAGGVVSDDAIRSLLIWQRLLGTEEIILIDDTGGGMLTFHDDEVKAQVEEKAERLGPAAVALEVFGELEGDVRQSLRRLQKSPYVDVSRARGPSTTSAPAGSRNDRVAPLANPRDRQSVHTPTLHRRAGRVRARTARRFLSRRCLIPPPDLRLRGGAARSTFRLPSRGLFRWVTRTRRVRAREACAYRAHTRRRPRVLGPGRPGSGVEGARSAAAADTVPGPRDAPSRPPGRADHPLAGSGRRGAAGGAPVAGIGNFALAHVPPSAQQTPGPMPSAQAILRAPFTHHVGSATFTGVGRSRAARRRKGRSSSPRSGPMRSPSG